VKVLYEPSTIGIFPTPKNRSNDLQEKGEEKKKKENGITWKQQIKKLNREKNAGKKR